VDLPHFVRNVKEKNVLLFKFRCNIFIGVRIIMEMPGSVARGTVCRTVNAVEGKKSVFFCKNRNTGINKLLTGFRFFMLQQMVDVVCTWV